MIIKKKINYFTKAFLITGFCIALVSCTGMPGNHSLKNKAKVKINDIAPNDLGQVMIFGESDDGPSVFVKNFYKSGKNQGDMHGEIKKYVDSLWKLKVKEVTIIYRKNNAGNLEVVDISQLKE